jgi:hypothetical protein
MACGTIEPKATHTAPGHGTLGGAVVELVLVELVLDVELEVVVPGAGPGTHAASRTAPNATHAVITARIFTDPPSRVHHGEISRRLARPSTT